MLQVADMETNPYLKTELGNIVRSRSELYQNLQLELNLMEERLGEIERVVISLGNGRLNKNLLSPSKLRETLKNIEKQLPSNYSLLFRSNEALWPYYRFVCKKSWLEKSFGQLKQNSSRKSKFKKYRTKNLSSLNKSQHK